MAIVGEGGGGKGQRTNTERQCGEAVDVEIGQSLEANVAEGMGFDGK